MDTSASAAAGDKRRLNKRGRSGPRRLHLRRTAAQPPTMQRQEKRGPKKTAAEEWERRRVWPSSKKEAQQGRRRRTKDGAGRGNAPRFSCPQCRDELEYSPKDLETHFEQKHRGSPPVFPCHACAFLTHEFSSLQLHLLSHKDTFSSCSICGDDVRRTWPEFSAHLTTRHCQNGKYSCETCRRFSTGDVRVFLEHVYAHAPGPEGSGDDAAPLHAKDKNRLGPKASARALRCQHCGYEADHKGSMTRHIKTVHVCQNGDQRRRRRKKEFNSIAMKANEPIPKMKPRLTRSAVREMCWLTEDCLSLPGREFLDKYCHLSDPQTTLEETQQFLMKSVAGETGDQKWTKALKTVLSNVPQDVNLHPKSENGITANASDLTVLTVKNKITVAQHGAAYGKRLRRMAPSSDKDTVFPESAADNARCVVDQNGCQSDLNAPSGTETKLHPEVSAPGPTEASECAQMQENRENQEVTSDKEPEEHGKKHLEPTHEDVINISGELRLTNDGTEQMLVHKVPPKNKRQRRRQKRKAPSKKVDKNSPALPLKIVLKKNPVKEMQWVSQSSLSPSGRGPVEDNPELPGPGGAAETAQSHGNAPPTEVQQKKSTRGSRTEQRDPAEGAASALPPTPGEGPVPSCAAKPTGCENTAENGAGALGRSPSTREEMQDGAGTSQRFSEMGDEKRSSAAQTGQSCPTAGEEEEEEEEEAAAVAALPTPGGGVGLRSADAATQGSYTEPSPVSQPLITPQGEGHAEDSRPALCSDPTDAAVLADSGSDLLAAPSFPVAKAIHEDPSPASGRRWRPAPKTQERSLKLVAINPSQLVKRPAGDQPVVVLNHPDADIPEVARIMEVVNRYRGEVQKVTLSRRTLEALSAGARTGEATGIPPAAVELAGHFVQERFVLKMKLRRLSRKKYEVVGAVSPGGDAAAKFRCWFCGRVFASQETWMSHRQRHLMEWKRPNCENS